MVRMLGRSSAAIVGPSTACSFLGPQRGRLARVQHARPGTDPWYGGLARGSTVLSGPRKCSMPRLTSPPPSAGETLSPEQLEQVAQWIAADLLSSKHPIDPSLVPDLQDLSFVEDRVIAQKASAMFDSLFVDAMQDRYESSQSWEEGDSDEEEDEDFDEEEDEDLDEEEDEDLDEEEDEDCDEEEDDSWSASFSLRLGGDPGTWFDVWFEVEDGAGNSQVGGNKGVRRETHPTNYHEIDVPIETWVRWFVKSGPRVEVRQLELDGKRVCVLSVGKGQWVYVPAADGEWELCAGVDDPEEVRRLDS